MDQHETLPALGEATNVLYIDASCTLDAYRVSDRKLHAVHSLSISLITSERWVCSHGLVNIRLVVIMSVYQPNYLLSHSN